MKNSRTLALFVAAAVSFGSSVFAADDHGDLKQNVVPLVAQSDKTLPRAPKDWKVELIAQPPKLHFPSVIEVAPDGRVFVAEDPMDMTGPGSKPLDRILCIFPDGHMTVFADHLYAVFGLRYIDGKLYVHQTPKFTVITDNDGIGTDPKDIWESDCLKPWGAGSLNDHIPSNLRVGMDNYLYLSTGDKGMFHAKSNVDGKMIDLRGGGVARIRPDGTDLEIYSTGTRNHLDLVINPEDEIFTYDNTDDGLGWWTRVTHMVDGGYYGYPFDYRPPESQPLALAEFRKHSDKPYKPYTLWRMDEFGGGAPTGGMSYNEDALPPEFVGNGFWCEWGKGLVERFVFDRDPNTATYKITERDNWMAGSSIRPLGIAVTADGMGFYVTDWQEGGWAKNEEKGRLYKLTYTGASHATPKPDWYIPAAEGKVFNATLEQLLAGLRHPAESVRLVAQRRIAERGDSAIAPLIALMNDTSAPAYSRWHAIWTLDRIDGGKTARQQIATLANDERADMSVRLQAVRQLGTRKATEATQVCIALLDSKSAPMRFRAATALGRIGSEAAVPALLSHLTEKDFFTHYSIFYALKRIGAENPKAWPAIIEGFASPDSAIRQGTMFAVRENYDPALVKALAQFVADNNRSPEMRAEAIAAIAPLHRERPAWQGQWWGTQPERTPQPAKTVEWEGTPIVLDTIHHGLNDSNSTIRRAAIDALQQAPDPAIAPTLVEMFKKETDVELQKSLLHALAAGKAPQALDVVDAILQDPQKHAALVSDAITVAQNVGNSKAVGVLKGMIKPDAPADVMTQVMAALGQIRASSAISVIARQLNNSNEKVAVAAASALGEIGEQDAVEALIPAVKDSRVEVKKAVIEALGSTQNNDAVPALMEAYKDEQTRHAAISALTEMSDVRALDAYLDGLGGSDAGLRQQCRRAMDSIRETAWPKIEAKLDAGEKFSPIAMTELRQLYSRSTPIMRWQIVGPFAAGSPDPFTADSITSSSNLPKGLKGAENKPVDWSRVNLRGRNSYVDLVARLDPHEHVYAYAVGEVNSTSDHDVQFDMGSDDGLIVWVNGTKIFEDLHNHSWNATEFHATGHLKTGTNIIVAKITQDGGPWGFSVAATEQGKQKLMQNNPAGQDVASYATFVTSHTGQAEHGSTIFHNANGVGCIKCHRVNGTGGDVGPDLSDIAIKYNRDQIVESVLYPSKQIESGYEQTLIRTKDGKIIAGVVRGETDSDVTLYDSSANKIVVRKADITGRRTSPISVMPEGLQAGLSHQDFADLITYLLSLKNTPKH